jgi:chromosome segregation ATPase
LARLELWIKRQSKWLTHWFTWEQVNFNRSVKDALADVIEILKAEAQELATLRGHLTQEVHRQARELREIDARLNQTEAAVARVSQLIASSTDENRSRRAEVAQQYSQLEKKFSSLVSEHSDLQVEHSRLAGQVVELVAQLRAEDSQIKSQQDQEINQRLSELAAELKEEQRVCFRQVSLEASESAVLEDRARRSLVERLEKIEAALTAAGRG